ncbi:DUF6193 family natural product biosynthesis protein [Streptomyces sp. NPDC020298]|uniref:DUF6193 family natural product biosynthesis protein n=1 Tax=unclassified Streptomyces TaxID=2593676 RepID=UPI0033D0BAF0
MAPSGPYAHAAYSTATADTGRGVVSVLLGSQKRKFSVSIHGDAHVWASGGTSDLASVAQVIALWRTGAPLRQLAEKCPFMEYDAMAQAHEDGDPVETQWEKVLRSDAFPDLNEILRRGHAHPEVRRLFPYVTHGALRFSADYRDVTAVRILVDPTTEGYRVETTVEGDAGEDFSSVQGVVDKLAELAARLTP